MVEPDHLTSVFVDTGPHTVAGDVAELVALARRLRGPGGCPWDAEQSHHSLTRYLLEEAYETVEVLEQLPGDAPAGEVDLDVYARVEDELGDLLFQVVFHSILATEAGVFDLGDVARGVHDKLVRRHPHVFGDVEADSASAVVANWEQIKKAERSSSSLVDSISPGLPSLLYAHKLYRKAASVGLEPDPDRDGFAVMRDALDRLAAGDRAGGGRGRARRPARGRGGGGPGAWRRRRELAAGLGGPVPRPLRADGAARGRRRDWS